VSYGCPGAVGGIDTCSWTIFQLPSFWRWKTSVKPALTLGDAAPA
jgi:hypothetical protein